MKKGIFLLVLSVLTGISSFSQWVTLSSGTGYPLNSVYFTNASDGFVFGGAVGPGGGGGIILRTNNGGTDWTTQWSGVSPLLSAYFPTVTIGYAVGWSGAILKTIDGGTNWTPQSSGTPNFLPSVYFIDTNTGWTVGDGGTILKTIDGGTNWTPQTSGTPYMLRSIYFTDANNGIAVGGDYLSQVGVILKTTNGGATWTTISNNYMLYSVFFTDPLTGYAAGNNNGLGLIVKTTDGGTNWTPLIVTSAPLKGIYFPAANVGYAVGDAGTIIFTTDAGENWNAQPSGTSEYLWSVFFPVVDTGYVVGTSGTILKTNNGGFPVGINENKPNNGLIITPNPSTDKITIETQVEGSLFVLNLNGQQILQQELTEPTTAVDVSGLKSGVYVVRVFGEKGVQVGKFIKQ